MSPAATTSTDADYTMQCMEVWGGNQAVDNGVVMPGLDAWVFSRPVGGDDAGGDIHYVSSCATGRITRMLVADVSGHGTSVAQTAGELRNLMKRYVNYLDQSRFVGELNTRFSTLTDSGMFATAFAATYWAPTSYLLACNAGHPPPLWRCGSTGKWRLLTPENARNTEQREGVANLPLGVSEPTVYEQFGIHLRKGDTVIIYTDALIETPLKSGGMLGIDGLLERAAQINDADPDEILRQLRDIVSSEQREQSDDDVTMMLLRRNEMKPRMKLADWGTAVKIYIRAIGSAFIGKRIPWPEWRLETMGGIFFKGLNQRWGGKRPPAQEESVTKLGR